MSPTVGQRVIVRSGFGRETPEAVTVKSVGEEMGRSVFDYTDKNGNGRWAYIEQIMLAGRAIERAA